MYNSLNDALNSSN